MRIGDVVSFLALLLLALTPSVGSAQDKTVHVNIGGGPTFNAGDLGEHFANGWGPAIGVTFDPTSRIRVPVRVRLPLVRHQGRRPVLRRDAVLGQPHRPTSWTSTRSRAWRPPAARSVPISSAGPGIYNRERGDHGVRRQRRHLRSLLVRVRHVPGRGRRRIARRLGLRVQRRRRRRVWHRRDGRVLRRDAVSLRGRTGVQTATTLPAGAEAARRQRQRHLLPAHVRIPFLKEDIMKARLDSRSDRLLAASARAGAENQLRLRQDGGLLEVQDLHAQGRHEGRRSADRQPDRRRHRSRARGEGVDRRTTPLPTSSWSITSPSTRSRTSPPTARATAATAGTATGRAAAGARQPTCASTKSSSARWSIDVADAAKKAVVWRGMGVKEVDIQAKAEKRDKNIASAVKKILKDFPPRRRRNPGARASVQPVGRKSLPACRRPVTAARPWHQSRHTVSGLATDGN